MKFSKSLRIILIITLIANCFLPSLTHVSAEEQPPKDSSIYILLEEDFHSGDLSSWDLEGANGSWTIQDDESDNKVLYQNAGGTEAFAITGDAAWDDIAVQAKIKPEQGVFSGILARYKDQNNFYMLRLHPDGEVELFKRENGQDHVIGEVPYEVKAGTWYELRMVLDGDKIIGYVNDQRLIEVADSTFTAGKIGFRTKWGNVAFDDVRVTSVSIAPDVPATFTVDNVTASTAQFSWETVAEAKSYRLYRSEEESGTYTQIYKGEQASFKDTDLSPTTTYFYKITAEAGGVESAMSSAQSITTTEAPPAPEISIDGKTDSTISLSWSEQDEAIEYHLYRALRKDGPYELIYSGQDVQFEDSKLNTGQLYFYKLAYFNGVDQSSPSNIIEVRTELRIPDTPDELQGIIAAYKFDETEGTTANSSAGDGGSATLINGATWTEGRTGGAVDLHGSDEYVQLPAGIVRDAAEMTIATWVKLDAQKTWSRIFDFGNDENINMFLTPTSGGNDTRFALKNGGSEQVVSKAPPQIAIGEWFHYAVTVANNTAVLYVNGEEVARSEVSIKPSDLGNTRNNFIGKSQYPDPYLDGKIDDFYIFNRALSPAEVALFTAPENEANVQADADAITLGDTSAVMQDLTLPTQGKNLSTITWKSSNEDIISHNGAVTRPEIGAGNATVTLTATITQGNAVTTKEFQITVLELLSEEDSVKVDMDLLTIPNKDAVTAKLTLPTEGPNGTTISWESSNPFHLRFDGMVSRPQIGAGDIDVTLTATVSKGASTKTKEFTITILEQDPVTAYLFAYKKLVDGEEKLHYAISRYGRNWVELGTEANVVKPIEGSNVFKLKNEDKWYKYEYANNAWTLYAADSPDGGDWVVDSNHSLPANALDGTFKPIVESEWIQLVHPLSEPRSLDVVDVTTKKGHAPKMPELVRIVYMSGLYTMVNVDWDDIDAGKYAETGTFTTTGTVEGFDTEVTATVTVLEDTTTDTIKNGEFWYDTDGAMIQAHGGHIIQVEDTYYWFGEDKGHSGATLKGVNVYASKDLKNWEFRNAVLTPASHPELAESKIERPKVLYNEKIGKYVLWGHWEEADNYNQGNVVVAVSDTIDGDYEFVYRFQPKGFTSRDFTVFQDTDGTAYLFSTANLFDTNVYRLTDDYLYVDEYMYTIFKGGHREAPAVVKQDGLYYFISSGSAGWYPNQGKYAVTADITDPNGWSELRNLGNPSTFYTQPSFIFTIKGSKQDTLMYAGDRWNPTALRESQYIWLPLELNNGFAEMSYAKEYDLNAETGEVHVYSDLLVSVGKPVESDKGENPAAANDGDEQNYFEFGGDLPVHWTVDLERAYDLSRIDLSWRQWNGSEVYVQYVVEGSNDGENFVVLQDQSKNKTPSFQSLDLEGEYRYVRVKILGQYGHTNNADRPVTWYTGLHEVKVFTSETELDQPVGLTAMPFVTSPDAKAATSVDLKWHAVDNATNYTVYRADKFGTYEEVYNGRAVEFADYGLDVNQTYYYKVQAFHPGGESVPSEPIKVTTFELADDMQAYNNKTGTTYTDEDGNPRIFPTLKIGSTYYYYEYVSFNWDEDGRSGFKQLNVYTSDDGVSWGNKKVVLDTNSHPDLQDAKFEGLHITYHEPTEKVIGWLHYELSGPDYSLGRAASFSGEPGEELTFHGSFRPEGNDSRDITYFKDDDGTGYIISAGNTNSDLFIYELDETHTKVVKQVAKIFEGQYREAPSMIKKDGIYYLFTSRASGWYPSQGMYASATSIEGPWSELRPIGNATTFSAQSGGIVTRSGTETTSYVMHANRWIHGWADWPSEDKGTGQRWLPIAFNNGYASFDYYEQILFSESTGIVVPVKEHINLSQGKQAYAPDRLGINAPSNVNDGDYSTRWISENNAWPKWWMVDLGNTYSLSNIDISWFLFNGSEAYYQYKVEISTDGVNFTTAIDRTTEGNIKFDYGFTTDTLEGEARYIRVQLVDAKLHNNPNNWYTPQLWEVKVFGHATFASLSTTLQTSVESGDISGSVVNVLNNRLRLAEKHFHDGKLKQSTKALEDMLKHIKKAGNSISTVLKEELEKDILSVMNDMKK
nr:immunoglobulin-like domain-containing protein [Paenibacillus bovis]